MWRVCESKEIFQRLLCVWRKKKKKYIYIKCNAVNQNSCRVQLKRDCTWWRTGGEVKGKTANGVGNQYPSHYLGTWRIQALLPMMRTPRLPVVDWTDTPADLSGLVSFAERRNLVSARVPSHFKRSVPRLKAKRKSGQSAADCHANRCEWRLGRFVRYNNVTTVL